MAKGHCRVSSACLTAARCVLCSMRHGVTTIRMSGYDDLNLNCCRVMWGCGKMVDVCVTHRSVFDVKAARNTPMTSRMQQRGIIKSLAKRFACACLCALACACVCVCLCVLVYLARVCARLCALVCACVRAPFSLSLSLFLCGQ